MYGFNPRAPIDFLPLPTTERTNSDASAHAEFIHKLHETTKTNIKKMNEKYRIAGSEGRKEIKLKPGDLFFLHLRKDRFLEPRKSKLMPRAAGPYKVIEKINDNAYKLESPTEFGVSPSFNISDLKPYLGEKDNFESRTSPIQEGEDDEDITPLDAQDDPPLDIQGPITRARARQLNLQVSSFLSKSLYDFENKLLPNDYIMLRNHGEHQGMHKGWLGGVERTPKSRRRPKPNQLRACFGVQDQRGVKRTPRTHPDSVFNVLPMDRNIIS